MALSRGVTLCLAVLVLLTQSAPSRRRRSGDGLDVGLRGDQKMSEEMDFEEEEKECYFSKIRLSSYESLPRPKVSEVSTSCYGPLQRMSELFDNNVQELYQAPNPLALVLARGGGEYVDWSSNIDVAGVGDRHICKKHVDELLTSWDAKSSHHIKRKYHKKGGSSTLACSMPSPFHPHDTTVDLGRRKVFRVESDEAEAILRMKGVLIHPGLPVCEEHNEMAKKVLSEYIVKKSGHNIRPRPFRNGFSDTPDIIDSVIPYTEDRLESDPQYFPPLRTNDRMDRRDDITYSAYETFMRAIGLSSSLAVKPWHDLSDRSRRRKSSSLRAVVDHIAENMSPDSPDSLKHLTFRSMFENEYERPRSDRYEQVMKNVRESFDVADTRSEKLASLSLISHLQISEIHKYIPSVSEYYLTEARKFARRGYHLEEQNHIRVKYDQMAIDRFISFVTSYKITIGLPFGVRRVRDSNNNFVEIPNTLRALQAGEIIHLYKKELTDEGESDLILPESTAKKILNICSATRRKSLHGVDQTIADAMESFDKAIDIISTMLQSKAIDSAWHDGLRQKILLSRQYLRTDFMIHAKQMSSIGDHCWNYGLSDPEDFDFQVDCTADNTVEQENHSHTLICDRCEQLQVLFGDFRAMLEEVERKPPTVHLANEIEAVRRDWHDHEERILKLKAHQLRVAKSENDRRLIVEDLQEGSALITSDFAMKLLPTYSRETTADFFGQRGLGWHITHGLTRVGDDYKTHNVVHLLRGDRQDSTVVTALLRHAITQFKAAGIHTFYLRSDQAGCYKSSSTIATIPFIAKELNVTIKGYYYSEAAAGKSACDRTSAIVKRRVRRAANANINVISPEDFLTAVNRGSPYNGISYYLTSVHSKDGGEPRQSTSKIDGLTRLNSFTFEPTGIRVHRYKDIGKGKVIPSSSFIPNDSVVNISGEGGKLDVEDFWAPVGEKKTVEKEDDGEDHRVCRFDAKSRRDKCENKRFNSLFRCPVESCGQEFLHERNLDAHMLLGRHRKSPERESFRDYALKQFSVFIEIVAPRRVCSIVDDAMKDTLTDNGNGRISSMGWALPPKRKAVRHSTKAKDFIKSLYDIGARTGIKLDPRAAAKKMREERKVDGTMYFLPEELLNSKQIGSLFSNIKRMNLDGITPKTKRTKTSKEVEVQEEEDTTEEEEEEEGDAELVYETDILFDDEAHMREEIHKKREDLFEGPTTRSRARNNAATSTEHSGSRKRQHDELF